MNIAQQLNELFTRYIKAFNVYNMDEILSCYHLPCTLHTPEKIAYLANQVQFKQEFIDIFTMLQHANISKIVANKASYQYSQKNAIDVCIDWFFYNDKNELFADFTAFYYMTYTDADPSWKIVSVVSHELQNSIALNQLFTIK